MTPYRAQHDALFRTVAVAISQDPCMSYEYAVATRRAATPNSDIVDNPLPHDEPSELAALIADVEGYERRQGWK